MDSMDPGPTLGGKEARPLLADTESEKTRPLQDAGDREQLGSLLQLSEASQEKDRQKGQKSCLRHPAYQAAYE